MMTDFALGVDLGGTKIYAIVTDSRNNVVAEAKCDTDFGSGPEKIAGDIIALGQEALRSISVELQDVPHIGVAVPTSVDPNTGDCHFAPNLGWKNFSMKDTFQKLVGREVYLGNDGNLGILGEYTCGSAQGFNTVIGYYVGTGLGGGAVIDGRVHMGNGGLAGEFGHAIIKQGGRRCGCGHRGCAEAYCSKIAFVKALKKEIFRRGLKTSLPIERFHEKSRNIKSKHLARAYQGGDPAVCSVINHGAYMLGVAAAGVCAILAPDCIILGGGVIDSLGQEMFPAFKASFDDHLFGLDPARVEVRFSTLGDAAVALGATILARRQGKV